MELNKNSIAKLSTVHKDLQKVIYRAAEITTIKFIVTYGIRTLEEQKRYVAAGTSKTMKSRHLDGAAVDLAIMIDGKINWDAKNYKKLALIVHQAAEDVGVVVECGADWTKFFDGPHIQLPWSNYPGKVV